METPCVLLLIKIWSPKSLALYLLQVHPDGRDFFQAHTPCTQTDAASYPPDLADLSVQFSIICLCVIDQRPCGSSCKTCPNVKALNYHFQMCICHYHGSPRNGVVLILWNLLIFWQRKKKGLHLLCLFRDIPTLNADKSASHDPHSENEADSSRAHSTSKQKPAEQYYLAKFAGRRSSMLE